MGQLTAGGHELTPHPSDADVIVVLDDGRIVEQGNHHELLARGGAYATLSAVVLSRGLIHSTGPYRCEHVRIRGRAVMTNTPPNGAFRGFGGLFMAPPLVFASGEHFIVTDGEPDAKLFDACWNSLAHPAKVSFAK